MEHIKLVKKFILEPHRNKNQRTTKE